MSDLPILIAGLMFLALGSLFIFWPDVADYLHQNFGTGTGPTGRRPAGLMGLTLGALMTLIWLWKHF